MRTALWGCWKKINTEQEVRRENGATKSVSKMWTWKRCDGLDIFFGKGEFLFLIGVRKNIWTAGPWKKKDWTLLSCTWYAIKALQHSGLRMERWGEIPFHETGHRYLSGECTASWNKQIWGSKTRLLSPIHRRPTSARSPPTPPTQTFPTTPS